MKRIKLVSKVALAFALSTAAFSVAIPSEAVQPSGPGYACADIYDPVRCSDGKVYGNACYASLAGATGCVRIGDV